MPVLYVMETYLKQTFTDWVFIWWKERFDMPDVTLSYGSNHHNYTIESDYG